MVDSECERCSGTGIDPDDTYCNSCGEESSLPTGSDCCEDGEVWEMPCRECGEPG